jgi:ATP-dependent Clp protease ATP-binding subunit ClpA
VRRASDSQYGARPLKRTIQKEVVNQISKMILSSEVHKGDHIKVEARDGELVFNKGENKHGYNNASSFARGIFLFINT